jgi:hypothetical protein
VIQRRPLSIGDARYKPDECMKVFSLFLEIIAEMATIWGLAHYQTQKIKPATLSCGGFGSPLALPATDFLVKPAHHADELKLCHHALHQRAKGLICLIFFKANK